MVSENGEVYRGKIYRSVLRDVQSCLEVYKMSRCIISCQVSVGNLKRTRGIKLCLHVDTRCPEMSNSIHR